MQDDRVVLATIALLAAKENAAIPHQANYKVSKRAICVFFDRIYRIERIVDEKNPLCPVDSVNSIVFFLR